MNIYFQIFEYKKIVVIEIYYKQKYMDNINRSIPKRHHELQYNTVNFPILGSNEALLVKFADGGPKKNKQGKNLQMKIWRYLLLNHLISFIF